MADQLRKLTTALYSEGVEKGEKRAAEITDQAQKKASQILSSAKRDAERIIKEAENQAKAYRDHVETETRIAAREIIHDFHQAVTDMILARVIDEKVTTEFSNLETLSAWIGKIIENWSCDTKEQPSLAILLSEKDLARFNKWFEKEVSEVLRKKVLIQSSENIESGFQIIPQKASYKIDISAESFQELFRHYLKARTRKLLFGETL